MLYLYLSEYFQNDFVPRVYKNGFDRMVLKACDVLPPVCNSGDGSNHISGLDTASVSCTSWHDLDVHGAQGAYGVRTVCMCASVLKGRTCARRSFLLLFARRTYLCDHRAFCSI